MSEDRVWLRGIAITEEEIGRDWTQLDQFCFTLPVRIVKMNRVPAHVAMLAYNFVVVVIVYDILSQQGTEN